MHTDEKIKQCCKELGINSVATELLIKKLNGSSICYSLLPKIDGDIIEVQGIKFHKIKGENYCISRCGKLYGIKMKRICNPYKTKKYLVYTLSKGRWDNLTKEQKHLRSKFIHKLVAEMFVPNPENKTFVSHIDGNPCNNNAYNLEWVTGKEYIIPCKQLPQNENEILITDTQFSEMTFLRNMGVSPKEISKIFGINESVIYGRLSRETVV